MKERSGTKIRVEERERKNGGRLGDILLLWVE